MKVKLASVVALFVLLLGARFVPKDVIYFQGMDVLAPKQAGKVSQTYTSKIRLDDLLTITVTAWDPAVVTPFNPPVYAYATQGEITTVSSGQLRTHLANQEGDINFPVLGKTHVAGLTKQQLGDKMQEIISPYVKDALVSVQIVDYKVTMMGEVSRSGVISVKNDCLSILDAIGQVGDLTINASHKNILVIRGNSGEEEFARLDITEPDIFISPCHYLQQNDVVYVGPNNAKKRNARYSQAQQYSITVFPSVLSAVFVITTVILVITK